MYLWRWGFSMGRKPKLSAEIKISICKQYLNGEKSAIKLSGEYDVNTRTINRWAQKYQSIGASAFNLKIHNASYTKEFKQQVVEAYLNGEGSMEDLANRYDISSHETLHQWIRKYNNLEELKNYDPKPEVYMKDRSRKTALAERMEIVNYCLEHESNYKQTAELFDVSYTQVYQWVKKYQSHGEDGLVDRRGKHKSDEQLSDNEALHRKVKILERQLREKEMEIDLLKKVEEIERRRSSPKRKTKPNT